ncbi:FAS1-like dehydratase domain-containing protein [Haladaptatus sp. DFWS20]|uniref:FAS1-like dehydratase domain-containing protein n=1 Tax=Haladaptatus sp. DFWS20 TaxID=3403467 RepID=UPI003EBAD93F
MTRTNIEGTELPSGEFTVEDWKAYLWADATRNDEDTFRYDEAAQVAGEPRQLVPFSMCQHIVVEATGGIEETMGRLADDWTSGAALGQLRAEFHAPLETGQPLQVSGYISNVDKKEGSTGPLTIVTQVYEVTMSDGAPVFDMEADMVLMGEE